ncbi:MAG TPA: hypothetical protein VFM43_08385 [Gaiellaceae bacterium]|nr:hypothetical protein [Gaiellaceae bacterium]
MNRITLVFNDRREVQLAPDTARALAQLLWERAQSGHGAASAAAAIQAALRLGRKVELDERESSRVSDALAYLRESSVEDAAD